jgi:hypothetical protein
MGGAYDLQPNESFNDEVISAVSDFVGGPLEAHADAIAAASPATYVTLRSAPLLLMHNPTGPDAPGVRLLGQPVLLARDEAHRGRRARLICNRQASGRYRAEQS